jgi:environmental stress-induced protein Ves
MRRLVVRLSVADIERDGPFSAFAGLIRWFAVLSGAGVLLGNLFRLFAVTMGRSTLLVNRHRTAT